MVEDMVTNLEETYGKYKSGMRNAITERLDSVNDNDCDRLYSYLIQEYDMARPPSLKVILSTMFYHDIHGVTKHQYSCSVCEFCGMDFSTNSLLCPHCKKLRKYGIVKMLKDKPPWHMAEVRQRLKDKLEFEDKNK